MVKSFAKRSAAKQFLKVIRFKRGYLRKTYICYFKFLLYVIPAKAGIHMINRFSGDYRAGVTPLPISNREVKLRIADGTTTAGLWESRSSPDLLLRLN